MSEPLIQVMSEPSEDALALSWAAWWGVLGFAALLIQALVRLAPLAWEPIADGSLLPWQWGLLGASVAFNGYAEGYKGFQLQVAPRVVARALHLGPGAPTLRRVLAPLFCMALFGATRKRLIVSWSLYAGLVVLIVAVRQLAQPWRGIIDAGVVVGLSWGLAALLWCFASALAGRPPKASPELP